MTTKEILNQNLKSFINFIPAQNSNSKKQVRLIPIKRNSKTMVYDSLSQAANSIETSAGNISRAIKNGTIVKGYKAEIVNNKQN